jgi:hypothetical protein
MTAEILELGCMTKLDIPPEKILRAALDADLSEVVVIGLNKKGRLYNAASKSSLAEILFVLEFAKAALMRDQFEDEP